ncbi:hypothetical protein [Streptomyces sp. 130]|uniref:hypothetical protein n=1 Tax=Streptomyces sp. 130 TaxID=2591006 RepID=UPI0021B0CF4E|nr:hypothetical protein [Streptomyces sp. 130]
MCEAGPPGGGPSRPPVRRCPHSAALDDAHPALSVSAFRYRWAVGDIVAQQVLQPHGRRTGRSVGAAGPGACVTSAAFIPASAGSRRRARRTA